MRWGVGLVLLAACTSGGPRPERPADAGSQDAAVPTERCTGSTRMDIWAELPGVTATIEDTSIVLGDDGGELLLEPGICGVSAVLRLESAPATLDLVADWALDYEASGLPPDTRLDSLTLLVMQHESGDCVIGMTNGVAADRAWAGDYGTPVAPCGPFATSP